MIPQQHLPEILTRAEALFSGYDIVICDIWGVLHDGTIEYREAGDALQRFRQRGGTVVLLSNSPAPSHAVASILDQKRVRRSAWDLIVSSGDLARARLHGGGYERVYHIGPDRDLVLFEDQPFQRVDLADAEAVVATGLRDDRQETGEDYRPLLEKALAAELPLICANPDLVVDVGGVMLPCAGAIAQVYEEIGGSVYWAGKPHREAYERVMHALRARFPSPLDPARVLAIGDAMRTDIAGASAFGLDALLIAQGIHRDELMPDGRLTDERLRSFLAPSKHWPIAAMRELRW